MKRPYAILIILALVSFNCGGKEAVKPSADSLLTKEAFNSIETIKTAYQEKDIVVLQNHLATEIAGDILKELSFDKAELSFTPRMVRIDASAVMVNLNWQGIWVVKGSNIRERGIAVFILKGSPLKLIRIDGDNPFLIP